jgi:uncharacterized delta-60 repeat protein
MKRLVSALFIFISLLSLMNFLVTTSHAEVVVVPAGGMTLDFETGNGFKVDGSSSIPRTVATQSDGKVVIAGQIYNYEAVYQYGIVRLNANGTFDTSFAKTYTDSIIYDVVVQPDDKIIAVGSFTTYNGGSNRIVRLNIDGTKDSSFTIGTGANGTILTVALQSDGKVLIGGEFTSYNGVTRNRIARLNSDGSLDTTFLNTGTAANNTVQSIAIQSDGKIVIGGLFTNYNGTGRNGIARINTNGTNDTTFLSSGSGASNADVRAVAIQSDGDIYIGGSFLTYNSVSSVSVARLNSDGSLDSGFDVGTGAVGAVNTIDIQDDGKVLLGGRFSTYNGTLRKNIVRVNSDGSIDSNFDVGSGATNGGRPNDEAFDFTIQEDGNILLVGGITYYNGTHVNNIVRINQLDGSIDSGFGFKMGMSSSNVSLQGSVLVPLTDGKVLIGGTFIAYDGVTRNRIARLNADGSLDTSFLSSGSGADSTVYSIAVQDDGKILIGGFFTSYNGVSRYKIARLNADGSLDTSFLDIGTGITGSSFSGSTYLLAIAVQDDGKILIGGDFLTYNGQARSGIARLNSDGSLDSTFVIGTGMSNRVRTIAVQKDGKILVGGEFTTYNGVSRNRILRLNSDGGLDNTFIVGTGFDGIVNSVVIQDDGKIIVAGGFTSYNGTNSNRIARLDSTGGLDSSFNIGTGPSNQVKTLTLLNDGKVLIGGFFTTYNGISRVGIARVRTDGSLDNSLEVGLGATNGQVNSCVQNGSSAICTGSFKNYNGVSVDFIVSVNLNAQVLNQIANLVSGSLDVVAAAGSVKVGTSNGSTNPAEQVTLKATGNVPLSDFVVDFSNGDVDFAGVTAGSDAASGKAFLSGLNDTAIPELSSTHSLYIPKHVGQTSVHICPDATQMSEVFMGCSNGYTLNYGGASNLSIVNISGQDYWRVTGLTGTGGLGTYSNGVSLTITPNNGLESVAQEVDVTYTSGGGFVNGDVIQLTWDAGITLANCTTPTTDADGDLTNDGSSSVVGQTYTYTYSGNATSSVDLCMSVQGLSGNYAVTLNDDNGSFSSALYYINPDGGDVNVIANIAPTLSFNIRNIDDSADLNVCNFGDVSTSTPVPNTNGTVDSGECGYSLAVGTNSSTGFTMQMSSNGALTNGVSNINNVLNNGTWSAGEEAYGIAQVIVGQTGRDPLSGDYDQSLTREGNFLTDTTPVPTTATDFVTYTDGVQYEAGNLDTDVTKVIHGLVVGAGTPAGSYSQVVTYTVTASF